ncbi:MAG TPA: hypothetical protein VHX65_13000 [Pirellulales bacterium]|jgi:hypothetical protein|nr:hypothetical protein [Pirellulales bacterium]
MLKNRISKYFSAAAETQPQPEPPSVNPSAFVGMPNGVVGPAMPGGMPSAPKNIYEIALAAAQRKIAEERAKEHDDLAGWFNENF